MARILSNRHTTTRFKIDATKEEAATMLRGAIMAEVVQRLCTFTDSNDLTNQIDMFADWLTNPRGKFCMVFFGHCGNGKTTMIKALQQVLNHLEIRSPDDNTTIGLQISNARDIAAVCRDNRRQWLTLCRAPMLAIDDLGTEPIEVQEYGNRLNPIVDLLYKRYDDQLFTIITTNLKPEEIKEKYGERIADRLNEMSSRIVFENESYRRA